jgi:CRP/FNR family transcriptional regulator, cyclic AMP receptor protein
MTAKSMHRLLGDIDLFSGVPDSVLSDLASVGTTFTTPPGGTAVVQGSISAGLQVVLEGSALVEVNGVRRSEVGPGQYFGEISVIDGQGRSATLIAGEDGLETFAISPANFSQLIDKHPALARSLLAALCARIRSLESAAESTTDKATAPNA